MERHLPLEPAAEKVSKESACPPFIFQLPPDQGRASLEKAQDTPIKKYPAHTVTCMADTGQWGQIKVHFVIPDGISTPADAIFYIHGAGWVFGSLHTHDKLVRELASRSRCVVIFPEYSLSPEAKYPTAIEQCYSVLCQAPGLARQAGLKLDFSTFTVAGDSVGGNMAAVMTLLAKQRHGPKIQKQLLYYPVTNACFHTGSYREFACGYYLYRAGMQWFWDQYAPNERDRRQVTASPLRASLRQLHGLPDAMIINGEADVLRDEGQAYARKLRRAGVEVTDLLIQGTIHDFVMLNALDQSAACRAAMDASTAWIVRKNKKEHQCASNWK
ncbi:alpha/beta hydrolase [Massiliimalia timonensis]|uniref:alpha/beta hydrolase n=1 Tax=Massiliimalia timonensis TaxID=1987501 RepID=UPI000B8A9B2D|nr:alpha/beta hydrolase [Massiliimalia timonensis]MBS7176074.1 alpha/beta hydrolase [Clostridiales bacterium]